MVLNEFKVAAAPAADANQAQPVALKNAQADFSQDSYPIAAAIDGNAEPASGWALAPKFGEPHVAVFETAQNVGLAGGTTLSITLDQQFDQHSIGRFRISVTTSPRPLRLQAPPAPIAAILAVAPAARTPEQLAELSKHFRAQDAELARLTAIVAQDAQKPDAYRLLGAQDLAWALLNSPAFLFNR